MLSDGGVIGIRALTVGVHEHTLIILVGICGGINGKDNDADELEEKAYF